MKNVIYKVHEKAFPSFKHFSFDKNLFDGKK